MKKRRYTTASVADLEKALAALTTASFQAQALLANEMRQCVNCFSGHGAAGAMAALQAPLRAMGATEADIAAGIAAAQKPPAPSAIPSARLALVNPPPEHPK